MLLECVNLNGIQAYLVIGLHRIKLGFSILLLQKCKYAGVVNKKDFVLKYIKSNDLDLIKVSQF